MRIRRWAAALALLVALAGPVRAAGTLHTAYLTGFPDGTIRAEAALTRAQLAVIFLRLAEGVEETEALDFTDLAPTHWAYGAACLVCQTGLMEAEDGCFRPDEPVSGPELAWILARLAGQEMAAARWPALRAGWDGTEISFAAGNGWVVGFDGQRFDETAALCRGQAAEIFNALLRRGPGTVERLQVGMPVFEDNRDVRGRYFLPIQEAAVTHTAQEDATGEVWTGLG